MRICLIISQSPPSACTADESSFLKELAPALVDAGHDVTVITDAVAEFNPSTRLVLVPVEVSDKIRNSRLAQTVLPAAHAFAHKYLGFWHTFANLNGAKQFDIVHAPASQAGALLSAVAREIPSVLTVDKQFSIEKTTRSNFDENFEILVRDYVFNCADAICFYSAKSKDAFAEHYADIDRISLIDESSGQSPHAQLITCFEKAIKEFASVRKPKLYRHGAQRLIKSAEDMILLFERMLYDLLFRVSYRFRLKHWLSMLFSRPEVFASKLRQSLGLKS